MGEIKVCQGARYFSWGFNSFLNMSRPVWDKMACIREMGALLIYMGANLCILHQGISKCKKLRMQIFAEWLSVCKKFAQLHIYKIFRQFYSLFCYFQTPITESFGQQIHISMPCPALILKQKKGKARERQLFLRREFTFKERGIFPEADYILDIWKKRLKEWKNLVEETIAAVEM